MSLLRKAGSLLLTVVVIVICGGIILLSMPTKHEVRYSVKVYRGQSNATTTPFSYNVTYRADPKSLLSAPGTENINNRAWTRTFSYEVGRVSLLERVLGQSRPKFGMNVVNTSLINYPTNEIIRSGTEVECIIEHREGPAQSFVVVAKQRAPLNATCDW